MNVAERLRLAPDAKVVILHVDNVGLCHAHNLGYFDVIEAGVATCGSVVTPSPWFPEVANYVGHREDLDLGVHLIVNSEFMHYRWRPLLGAHRVPSLVDRDGYFWPSAPDTLSRADPEEVRAELQAQIELALHSGIDVSHLDSHLGTVMMRQLLPVYISLGREYRIPVFFPRPTRELLSDVGRPELFENLMKMLRASGVADSLVVDHAELRSLSFDPEHAEEHFRSVIAGIRPGVTHFLINPAQGNEELEAMTPDSWLQRDAERRVFSRPAVRRWFEEEGIRLIGYREIRDALRAFAA